MIVEIPEIHDYQNLVAWTALVSETDRRAIIRGMIAEAWTKPPGTLDDHLIAIEIVLVPILLLGGRESLLAIPKTEVVLEVLTRAAVYLAMVHCLHHGWQVIVAIQGRLKSCKVRMWIVKSSSTPNARQLSRVPTRHLVLTLLAVFAMTIGIDPGPSLLEGTTLREITKPLGMTIVLVVLDQLTGIRHDLEKTCKLPLLDLEMTGRRIALGIEVAQIDQEMLSSQVNLRQDPSTPTMGDSIIGNNLIPTSAD